MHLWSKASVWEAAGIGLNGSHRFQARRSVYAVCIEDGIEKYKTVSQEVRWEMITLVNMKE